jgi:hypothetical protein
MEDFRKWSRYPPLLLTHQQIQKHDGSYVMIEAHLYRPTRTVESKVEGNCINVNRNVEELDYDKGGHPLLC